jgi:hypothetical protein
MCPSSLTLKGLLEIFIRSFPVVDNMILKAGSVPLIDLLSYSTTFTLILVVFMTGV